MLRYFLVAILGVACISPCQSPKSVKSPSDAEVLLAKAKALYDTPFQSGLINFSCAVNFDFVQYVKSNFGPNARPDSPVAQLLKPISYLIFLTTPAQLYQFSQSYPTLADYLSLRSLKNPIAT